MHTPCTCLFNLFNCYKSLHVAFAIVVRCNNLRRLTGFLFFLFFFKIINLLLVSTNALVTYICMHYSDSVFLSFRWRRPWRRLCRPSRTWWPSRTSMWQTASTTATLWSQWSPRCLNHLWANQAWPRDEPISRRLSSSTSRWVTDRQTDRVPHGVE